MSARTQARTAKKSASDASSVYSIPPLAIAVARAAESPEGIPLPIPEAFVAAWPQIPVFMRAIADGTVDNIGATDYHSIVNGMIDARLAKGDELEARDLFAEAFALMDRTHGDMRADVVTPITMMAFYTGVAYAYHMLTGGAR